MEFNRDILAEYMKTAKLDEGYIYRLYKTYNNMSKLTNNNFDKKKLKELEDSIYNYNGEVLDDKTRIKIELSNIKIFFDTKKITKNSIVYDKYEKIVNLYKKIDLNNDTNINYLKKQISILQSQLGMDNTFFLASKDAFMDIYRNVYINYINDYRKKVNR